MHTEPIHTHSGSSFLDHYVQPGLPADTAIRADVGRFFIVRIEAMSGHMKLPVPPTRIPNHLFLFLEDGEALMHVGSEAHRIRQHQCLFVPAGQVFSFNQVEPNRGYLCNFHDTFVVGRFARPEFLKELEFLQVWGNAHMRPTQATAEFVGHLLGRMLHHYAAEGLSQPDCIQSSLVALLCEIRQAYPSTPAVSPTSAVLLTNQFKDLLFTHLRTHHLVSEYAALLHVSPNHLNKVVKATTGKSPTRWIDEALVLEAKVWLHQTQLPVGDVAARIGVYDPSYFSRLFKKYEGITPLSFRRLIETS